MSAKQYSGKVTVGILNDFINDLEGKIDIAISHIMDEVESTAQANARKRTGRMAAMTTKKKISSGNKHGYEVSGTAPYTKFQHDGTKYIEADPYILNAYNEHASPSQVYEAIKQAIMPH